MWVKFTAKYCWVASDAVSIIYKPNGGTTSDGRYNVTRGCAKSAIDAGCAEKDIKK